MTSGNDFSIRPALTTDIDAIKQLADKHRNELGFLRRPALLRAIQRCELLVAQHRADLVGFIEYRHRQDKQTTLYNVVVHPEYRGLGVGRHLVFTLEKEAQEREKSLVLLKCPDDLPANQFYERIGYEKSNVEAGKSRRLNIWRKNLP